MATLRPRYVDGTLAATWVTVPAAEALQTFSKRAPEDKLASAEAGSFRKVLSPWLMEMAAIRTFMYPEGGVEGEGRSRGWRSRLSVMQIAFILRPLV
jgi:hypothetical protein